MNILVLSSSNPLLTAGIVAYDIYKELSSIEGNDVRILVKVWDNYEDSRIIPIQSRFKHYIEEPFRLYRRIKNKILRNIIKGYKTKEEKVNVSFNHEYGFEQNMDKTIYSTSKILSRVGFYPDIVLVLFMTEFISFKNLYEINKITKAAIYLYPMDMAPFTGGCHCAWNCKGYQTECGNCPAIYSKLFKDKANYIFNNKKYYIEQTQLELIAGSEYLLMQISKSSLFKNKKSHKILLPINEEHFKPGQKTLVRNKLGLPIEKKVVLIRSISQKDKHKGYYELNLILQNLLNQVDINLKNNIYVIAVGRKNDETLPFPHKFTGYLTHEKLSEYFQAADIFVSPSIEDSGPMMINQSIMSGTPVVAFDIGVALDLVYNGETGYRAKLKDIDDFTYGIKYILELEELQYNKISANCREMGIRLCDPQKNIKRLMDIFNVLL